MATFSTPFAILFDDNPADSNSSCETCYTVSLTQLISRVRERTDTVGSSFVSDSAITDWINEAHSKLHGMLVEAFAEEYSFKVEDFTTVAGQTDYPVTCCFYKLYGVDLDLGGRILSLKPFNRNERNFHRNMRSSSVPGYRLSGNVLRIFPAPQPGLTGQISYAAEATLLSSGSDTVKYPNGWERFIVLDAAIQVLIKEESETSALVRERELIRTEIEKAKELRTLDGPYRVVDMDIVDFNQDYEPGW